MDEIIKGDKVIINNIKSNYNGKEGIVFEVKDNSYPYPIGVQIDDLWHMIHFNKKELIKVIEPPIEHLKSNKVQYNESTIEWDIVGLRLKVKVGRHPVNMRTLLKILIQEIPELQEYTYKRVSPYKIVHEFARKREDKNHVFSIQFMDVRNKLEITEKEAIRTNWNMGIDEGSYSYFIPDLLEVAIDRNLVKLDGNTYKCRKRAFSTPVELKYIDTRMSRTTLEKKGWKVPNGYREPIIDLNNSQNQDKEGRIVTMGAVRCRV